MVRPQGSGAPLAMPALMLPGALRLPPTARSPWGGWGTSAGAKLFVSVQSAATVDFYTEKGQLQGQLTGFGDPVGLAVDSSGYLYVADGVDNVVDVFAPGQTTPSKVLKDGTDSPKDVAVGADGTVYASNVTNGSPGSISVWAPGHKKPSAHITDPNVFNFVGVALDSGNNLYAAWYTNTGSGGVDEVPSGKTVPMSLGLQNLFVPLGMAVNDGAGLVIADAGDATVKTYRHGAKTPSGSIAGFGQPTELAFDPTERLLFVSDARAADVVVVTYPKGIVKRTISAGLSPTNYPWGVALSPPAPR